MLNNTLMNGLYFLLPVAIIYFLRKEWKENKIKRYIKERGGRYISEIPVSLYKDMYIIRYEDGQNNIRRVRVRHKIFKVVFEDDELIGS